MSEPVATFPGQRTLMFSSTADRPLRITVARHTGIVTFTSHGWVSIACETHPTKPAVMAQSYDGAVTAWTRSLGVRR